MAIVPGSILDGTKQALGIDADHDSFDPEIIMFINSAFSTLRQIGVGPSQGFRITDNTSKWDTYHTADPLLSDIQSYVYLRVRLLFDPPTMGYLVDAIKEQIKEHEWRLNVAAEAPVLEELVTQSVYGIVEDQNTPSPSVYFVGDPNG